MTTRGARLRRSIVALAAIVAATTAIAAPAGSQDPGLPEVNIEFAEGAFVAVYNDCDGSEQTDTINEAFVAFVTEDRIDQELTVAVSLSGTLVDNVVDPPSEVVLQPIVGEGPAFGELLFEIDPVEEGTLALTIEPGAGYTVGPGADTGSDLDFDGQELLIADCREDLGEPPGGTDDQTIEVGERPEPLGFFENSGTGFAGVTVIDGETVNFSGGGGFSGEGISTPAVGTLPPGLTYENDRWGGAATTPGEYTFDVRLCIDDAFIDGESDDSASEMPRRPRASRAITGPICFGTVYDVRIEVLPASATPPPASPTAPPASPITGPARFTG